MKNLFVLAILLFSMSCMAQPNGVNIREAKSLNDYPDNISPDGTFVKYISDDGTPLYIYMYDLTPVKYKHCVQKLVDIIEANGGVRPSDADQSLIPSYVENEYKEYSDMVTAISVGSAEIWHQWDLDNGWVVVWKSTEKMIGITMWNRGKSL